MVNSKLLIWSAIGFFIILLGLLTAGIYLGPSPESPFLQPFFSLVNIVAAVCAGIMTSELSGFLAIKIKKKWKKGLLGIKAGGGFAVFLLVLSLNPQAKMFSAADAIFANISQACSHAVESPGHNPDASGICNELVNRFPNHPEGYYQLGILLGRTDSTVEGLSKAVEHFKKSAKLLQVINNNTFEVSSNHKLGLTHRSMAIDSLTRLVGIQSEIELKKHYGKCNSESSLESLVKPLFFCLKKSPIYIQKKHLYELKV